MKKRVLSFLLVLLFLFTLIPKSAMADDDIIQFADPYFKYAVLTELGKTIIENVTKA